MHIPLIIIGYRDLEETLAQMQGVHAEDRPALRAKLKYLKRLGMPEQGQVGKGGRTLYATDDMVQLALVFELMTFGISTQHAMELVLRGWRDLRAGLAATEHQADTSCTSFEIRTFLMIQPSSTNAIQDECLVARRGDVILALFGPSEHSASRILLIEARSFLERTAEAFSRGKGYLADIYADLRL